MEKIDTSHIKEWPSDVILGMAKISEEVSNDIFSNAEWSEYNDFKSLARKAEYLSVRRLFWYLIQELELESKNIQLLKEGSGKPYAKKGDNLFFVSFSHSFEKVFCAISFNKEIGVDIEHTARTITQPVLERICNEKERAVIDELNPLKIWTIKEAVVKCMGSGLRTNLNDLIIERNEKNRFYVRFNNESLFEICSFKQSDHQIALAYQSQPI